MTLMLDFYHELGVILKHGNTVVLDTKWLIDLFKKVITVRPFKEAVRCQVSSLAQIYRIKVYQATQ